MKDRKDQKPWLDKKQSLPKQKIDPLELTDRGQQKRSDHREADMNDLLENEELLRITLQSIGDAVMATDDAGQVVQMNPVAETMTGWSLAEARGKPLSDIFNIINAKTGKPADDTVAHVLATGNVVGLANHTMLIARNGREYQIMDRAAPIRDDKGKTRGVVLVFSDVTDQYAAEEALRLSEERWHFALESSGDGVWDRNLETEEIFFSSRWKAILGYEDHEIGNTLEAWLERIHPDDRQGCLDALEDHFRGRSPLYIHEYRLRRKDGSYVWILARGKVISRDERGFPRRFIGTHTDVTDRKTAEYEREQALREAREQARRQKRHMEMLSELLVDLWIHENDTTSGLVTVTETAAEILTVERAGVWFFNEDQSKLVCRNLYDSRRNWHGSDALLSLPADSEYRDSLALGQVVSVSDLSEDSRTTEISREYFSTGGIVSLIHVPVRLKGDLAAVLSFEQVGSKRDWLPEEEQMALTLGSYLSNYLEGAARRQAEDKFRSIFENALEGIFQSTPEGRFIAANPAFARMAGYESPEDFIASVTDIERDLYLHAHDRLRYQEILAEKGAVAGFEAPLRKRDGTVFWVNLNSRAVRNDQGDILLYEGTAEDITDRKKAEDERKKAVHALGASEENFRRSLDESPLGIRIVSEQGKTLYGNRTMLALFGYDTLEEWLAVPGSKRYTRETYERHEERKKARKRNGSKNRDSVEEYEIDIVTKDGQVRHLLTWRNRILWNGKDHYQVIYRDITGRKRAEAGRDEALRALRESEEKYRLVVENANDVIWTFNLAAGTYDYLSPSLERVYGFSSDDVSKMALADIHPPESLEQVLRAFEKLGTEEFPDDRLVMEAEHYVGTGRTLWMEISATAIKDDLGRVVGFAGVSRDINDRKLAEVERERAREALRESEERYRDIFHTSPDSVSLSRLSDGVNFDVNDQFLRITGYSRDEVVGASTIDLGLWYDTRERKAYLSELKDRGYVSSMEARFRMKDGRVTTGLISSSLLLIDGEPYVQAIIKDITDLKEMESQRRDLERHLARAQKLESIGTLAGGIAHDFNNLLMGIQGYTSLMLLDLDSSHAHYARLKHIEEQVGSGAGLTNQLLGFARGGRYEVKPASINEIVEKTAAMFGRTKKEVAIHKRFESDLWNVEVDRTQMEQVFMNLYVNAWQAMVGGGELYLETENLFLDEDRVQPFDLAPGPYVKISVTDTGMGMDGETRERIFDPFFSTKAMGRGTGLGLATVYGIVRGHRGIINVYSEPGRGTTFTLYLPASEKTALVEEAEEQDDHSARGTETILLVDDEVMVLDVNRELLEFLGYTVHTAGSGQEAVALYVAKKDEIDLVILDMIMPGISGSGAFDQLREINPDVKVILSSGYSLNGEARDIMDRGCDSFLQKPFHLHQLLRKIRNLLD